MNIREAIILAGGLGTRLRNAVPDLPKCMAPVNGQPFIHYVLQYLLHQGIEKFIFALGYKHEYFVEYLAKDYPALQYQLSVEKEPLGTGGAIRQACGMATEKTVLVLNGDTLYNIDLTTLSSFHQKHRAHCTLCLKPMENMDRYGVVTLAKNGAIEAFQEKKWYEKGLINGGVYALQTDLFLKEDLPTVFSFEKDYLEKNTGKGKLYGQIHDSYFIDIGIPEDYERVQKELSGNL